MISPSPFRHRKALSYLSGTSGGALVPPPAQGIRPSPFRSRSLLEAFGTKSLDYEVKGRKVGMTRGGRAHNNQPFWNEKETRCYQVPAGGGRVRMVAQSMCPPKSGGQGGDDKKESSPEGQQQEQQQTAPKPKPKPKLGEVKQKPTVDSVQAGVEAFRTKENPTEDEKIIMINAISSLTVKEIKELQYKFLEKKEARGTRTGKRDVIVPKIVESILNKIRGTTISPKKEIPPENIFSDPVPAPENVEAVLPERNTVQQEPRTPAEVANATEEVPKLVEDIPPEQPKTPQEEAIEQTLPQGIEAATEKAEAIQSVQESAQALLEQTQEPKLQQEIIQQAKQEVQIIKDTPTEEEQEILSNIQSAPVTNLAELKQKSKLDPIVFDELILRLADQKKIVLSQDTQEEALSPEELEWIVRDPENPLVFYTTASPRQSQPTPEAAPTASVVPSTEEGGTALQHTPEQIAPSPLKQTRKTTTPEATLPQKKATEKKKKKLSKEPAMDMAELERIRAEKQSKNEARVNISDVATKLGISTPAEQGTNSPETSETISPLQEAEQTYRELKTSKVPDYKKRAFLGSLSSLSEEELRQFGTKLGIPPESLTSKRAAIDGITAKLNDKSSPPPAITQQPRIRFGDAPGLETKRADSRNPATSYELPASSFRDRRNSSHGL